jgi:hypothetical protein
MLSCHQIEPLAKHLASTSPKAAACEGRKFPSGKTWKFEQERKKEKAVDSRYAFAQVL